MFGGLSSPIPSFRNKLTKCSLTVVCRRSDKVVCRSNSLCFFETHTPTHVSLEICTFRCLVGHVFQRSRPVDRNICATTVNMSQVMICPDLIYKIHILGLTGLQHNEWCSTFHFYNKIGLDRRSIFFELEHGDFPGSSSVFEKTD